MSVKPLLAALMLSAGIVGPATSASAQDWWNPGSWSRPAYGYSAGYGRYGSSCSGGVCRPGYGTGYYRGGNYRSPAYGHASPNYSTTSAPGYYGPMTGPGNWGSNYRGPQDSRPAYNPFYE